MSVMPCMPPGELCALRGGVFVRTVTPRQRIACGWYSSETMRPDENGIAHLVVRAVVADDEHIEGGDPAFLGEADFHPAVQAGTPAADVVFFLAADAHHDRARWLSSTGARG